MRPETWLPTCTVTSADSVPVAVTLATIGPRSTTVVSYFGPWRPAIRLRQVVPAAAQHDQSGDDPDPAAAALLGHRTASHQATGTACLGDCPVVKFREAPGSTGRWASSRAPPSAGAQRRDRSACSATYCAKGSTQPDCVVRGRASGRCRGAARRSRRRSLDSRPRSRRARRRRRAAARKRSHLATRARLAAGLRGRRRCACGPSAGSAGAGQVRRRERVRERLVRDRRLGRRRGRGRCRRGREPRRATGARWREPRLGLAAELPPWPRRCRSTSRPWRRWRSGLGSAGATSMCAAGRGQQAGAERQRAPADQARARKRQRPSPARRARSAGSMPVGIACGNDATSAISVRGSGGDDVPLATTSTPVFSAIVANSVRSSTGVCPSLSVPHLALVDESPEPKIGWLDVLAGQRAARHRRGRTSRRRRDPIGERAARRSTISSAVTGAGSMRNEARPI